MNHKVSDSEFIRESVEFFNERVDQITFQFHGSNMTANQKTELENEKQIILERRNYWTLEQSKLLLQE